MTDQTRRPTEGDRVTIHAPGEPAHGLTGTIKTDDGTKLPFYVDFGGKDDDGAWFYPHQVALAPTRDAGPPVGWVPIREGRLMKAGDKVYVPPGTSSVHDEIDGNLGVLRLHLDIDEDGDLPVMVGGLMAWFKAADCYAPPEFAPGGFIPTPAAPEPEREREISVERRWTIRLALPVTAYDLARAAAMLPPGLTVEARRIDRHMEIVGTEDPTDG